MDDRDPLEGLAARTPNHSRQAALLHRAGERVRQPNTYDPNKPPTAVMVVGDMASDRLTQLIAVVERETASSLESNIILVRDLEGIRSGASDQPPPISQDLKTIVGMERTAQLAAAPEPPRRAASWEQIRDRAERRHRRRRGR